MGTRPDIDRLYSMRNGGRQLFRRVRGVIAGKRIQKFARSKTTVYRSP
jgi:hypothetical protein